MTPDDPRHGKLAGRMAGCDLPCCVVAKSRYEKQRQHERRTRGIRRLVDATGTRRRLRALSAIGWSLAALAAEMEYANPRSMQFMLHRDKVNRETAAKIAALFDRLSMTPGPSKSARDRALSKGWAPPLAWDEGTIDDPNAVPRGLRRDEVAA